MSPTVDPATLRPAGIDPAGIDPAGIDLASIELWRDDPHPTLDWLRANAPVHWQANGSDPFWSITRYDDIAFVNTHPELFSSGQQLFVKPYPEAEAEHGEATLLTLDGLEHRWLRAIVSEGFTPNSVCALEPRVIALATDILDRVAEMGEVDFVDDVAVPMPVTVIAKLIGLTDHKVAKQWSDAADDVMDADPAVRKRGMAFTTQMGHVLAELVDDRRAEPRSDLLSALVHAEVDGRRLTPGEQLNFLMLLNFAGNETTRATIAGGMHALLEHPDQLQRWRDDPGLLPTAIEEMLRYVTPVTHFARTATQDVELRGQQIRAGDRVMMWFTSGNRDEVVFDDPHGLDIGRLPSSQLAFGAGGPHFCLGAALARMELRAMFQMMIERFDRIELIGDIERQRSNFVRGIVLMPVRVTAR